MKQKIYKIIKILAMLWIASTLLALLLGPGSTQQGNVAVIPIHGMIVVGQQSSFTSSFVSSDDVIEQLQKADENANIQAIVLDINSPGGSGVASDEIGQTIKDINKTTVAVIREMGASGGYWIASTTDYIFANRMSMTGSIGVIASYLEFADFIDEHNITYRAFVSGKYKDMGSPFREPTEEEEEIWQEMIDTMELFFIQEVASNRNLTVEQVEEIATGQVYLGAQAFELGLIDQTGTKQDAFAYIEKELDITAEPVLYKRQETFTDLLLGMGSDMTIGKFIKPLAPKLT